MSSKNMVALVAMIGVLTGACWMDEEADDVGPLGIDDGASEGSSTFMRVAVGREATLSLDNGALLFLPPDAFDQEAEVGLARLADEEALRIVSNLPNTYKLASAPYLITPHGARFRRPVELTLPVSADAPAANIAVAWLEDELATDWQILDRPDIVEGKARIELSHFSVLLLVAGDPPEASALATIGPEGGTVELITTRGPARLTIPPGVLTVQRRFRVEQLLPTAIGTYNEFVPDPLFAFLPHGTAFRAPVTLEYPAREGASVALRRPPGFSWLDNRWEPVSKGTVSGGQASVQTIGLGLFTSGTSEQSQSVVGLCGMVMPLEGIEGCGYRGVCFAKSRDTSVRCSPAGQCECTGGAAGRASFLSRCDAGIEALMQGAADACEWSPQRPNLMRSSSWWEVIREPVASCSTGLNLVGGYVWAGPVNETTGLPGVLFDKLSWHEQPQTLRGPQIDGYDIRVVAARDGFVTDLVTPCVHLRHAPDAPCHEPSGLVQGIPTKLVLEFATSATTEQQVSERLQFVSNRVADPLRGPLPWMVHCWSFGNGSGQDPLCECVGESGSTVPWNGSTALGLAAVQRFARQEATAQDGTVLIQGCGWPVGLQFELEVNSQSARGPLGWFSPVCLAP